MITKDDIFEVAEKCHDQVISDGESWPDCYEVSGKIIDTLYEEYGVTSDNVEIVEFSIRGYKHYAVKVSSEVVDESDALLVDASFKQFANETDTPISVAPIEEIESCIVVPAPQYIFAECRTQV